MTRHLTTGVVLLLWICSAAHAATYCLANFDQPAQRYAAGLGREFPGAKATFRWHKPGHGSPGALAIDYDFTAGMYAVWQYERFLPSRVRSIRFRMKSDRDCTVLLRIVDATGQYLIERMKCPAGGTWRSGEWNLRPAHHWAGANDGKAHMPLRSVHIGPHKSRPSDKGTLWIDSVTVDSPLDKAQIQAELLSWYAKNHGWRARTAVPGNLFTPGQRQVFKITLGAPPAMVGPQKVRIVGTVTGLDGQPAGPAVEAVLSERNGYRASVEARPGGKGWFRLRWLATCGEIPFATPAPTDFAVIPRFAHDGPRPASPFGVNVHFTRHWPRQLAAAIARSGIAWIRDHATGPYDKKTGAYTADDPTFTLARRHNLCFLPISAYYRLRKQAGRWVCPEAHRQVEAYARRHRGRISHFEAYNEPHNFANWTSQFGGSWNGGGWIKPFTDFAKRQVQALRRGDPDILVLWPEIDLFCQTRLFVAAGALPELHVVAPHPYNMHKSNPLPEDQPFLRSLPEVFAFLKKHNIRQELWATEIGWATHSGKKPTKFYKPQTETEQAEKLVRALILQLYGGFTKFFWYDFYCDRGDPDDPEANFGLVRNGSMSPKPALVAYANAIHWLTDRPRWIGSYPAGGGGLGYAFRRQPGGPPVIVAWVRRNRSAETWRIPSGALSVTVTDIYGRAKHVPVKDGLLRVVLSRSPLFISGIAEEDVIPFATPRPDPAAVHAK